MAWRFQVQTVVRNAMIFTEKEYVLKETSWKIWGRIDKGGGEFALLQWAKSQRWQEANSQWCEISK